MERPQNFATWQQHAAAHCPRIDATQAWFGRLLGSGRAEVPGSAQGREMSNDTPRTNPGNYPALQCGQKTKFLSNFSLESALRCEVNRDNPGHKYFLHRADSWVSHNKTISDRKRGIRAVVTKSGSEVSILSFK